MEIARKLVDDRGVESLSLDTVWRILDHHADLKAAVREISDLDTPRSPRARSCEEYKRAGALYLFAAFETPTGKFWGRATSRSARSISSRSSKGSTRPPSVTTIRIVRDHVRVHEGKLVQAWLAKHPGLEFDVPPVPRSWMNQVEPWFSIIQRERLGLADFQSKEILREKIRPFIAPCNEHAQPFHGTTKSCRDARLLPHESILVGGHIFLRRG